MPRRRHNELQAFSGINVTPLMDLTFLLLIVFMITAPILEYTVDVSPPRMNAENVTEEESVVIGLDAAGKVLLDGESVSRSQLESHLVRLSRTRPDANILIRADQGRPYREVITLMKAARANQLFNIALVTRAEDE